MIPKGAQKVNSLDPLRPLQTCFATPTSLERLQEVTLEIAELCARNAAEIDQSGAFPVKEFAKIFSAGLLFAPCGSLWGLSVLLPCNWVGRKDWSKPLEAF